MVQGEKSSMLATSSCIARTADPFARKAGFEAVQRLDKQMAAAAAAVTTAAVKKEAPTSSATQNHGSWGPIFQNKQNFATMHWC